MKPIRWLSISNKVSRFPRCNCAQPRNLEEKRRKKYDSLQSVTIQYWTSNSHNSLGKSAQYLRGSMKLVWWLGWKEAWSHIHGSGQFHFKSEWSVIETLESARSWFFDTKSNEGRGTRLKLFTEYTAAERIMSTTGCSQAHAVTCVLSSSMSQLQRHLCACKRVRFQVVHVIAMVVLAALSLSQPTTWTARSSPGTLYTSSTTSTPRASRRTPRSASSSIPSSKKVRKNRYKSSLCNNEIQRGRTLRTIHSTCYEAKSLATDEFEPNELATKEFMTTSRSSLEDTCQLCDVQREFG